MAIDLQICWSVEAGGGAVEELECGFCDGCFAVFVCEEGDGDLFGALCCEVFSEVVRKGEGSDRKSVV